MIKELQNRIRGYLYEYGLGDTAEALGISKYYINKAINETSPDFDPIYGRGYYEDMDLSFKVRSLGHKVFVDTSAMATHGVGQTFKDLKEPLPIQQNQQVFKLRWANVMPWSEFEFW